MFRRLSLVFVVILIVVSGFLFLSAGVWDLSDYSYDNINLSVEDSDTQGVSFGSNGSRLYVIGANADKIYQYSCSSPWNLSSCSYDTISIPTQSGFPKDTLFSYDGSKLYEMATFSPGNYIYQYECSTPWLLSSCSYNFSIATQDSRGSGMFWKSDGLKMYETGYSGDKIYQSTCSIAWDLNSCSFDFSIDSQDGVPMAIFFSSDGSRLYEAGEVGSKVYQYDCSTSWLLSSCSYNAVSISVHSNPQGLFFRSDGVSFYVAQASNVYQYSVPSPTDSCTCAGLNTNWEVNLSDYCVLSEACDLGTGKLSFVDSGNFTCNAQLDTTSLGDVGSGNYLWINSGCIIYIS